MSQYIDKGKCIAPRFYPSRNNNWATIFMCGDPENCPEFFNESVEDHHYGCECEDCVEDYRRLKG